MKKSTKALMAGLLIVPAALAMTACGGEPSIIDVNGNYSAQNQASYAEVAEIMDNETVVADFDSYRMLLDIDMQMSESMPGYGSYSGGIKVSTDSLVNLADDFDMKSVITTSYTGIYAEMQQAMEAPTTETIEQYVRDGQGYMYDAQRGSWECFNYEIEDQPAFDFSGLFAGLTEEEQNGIQVWVDNNTEAGSTKIKMIMSAGVLEAFAGATGEELGLTGNITWGDAEVYYVLQGGELEGMKLSLSCSFSMTDEYSGVTSSGSFKISMQVAKDSTVIEFPANMEA